MKLLYSLLILFTIPYLTIAQNREADSLILVQVYNQLDGPNWNNPENWLSSAPLEEWKGIHIELDRVTKLEIIQQDAIGPFPDQILGLDQLHTFEIRNGEISGDIPIELTQLVKLKRFVLSATGIGGEMPNIWTQFPDLKTLSLSQGNITGSLPDLPNGLSLVTFQGNQLTGPIPQSWEQNDLSNLNISFNQLTGNFDILSTWTNLLKIDLDANNWDSSTLPTWIDDNIELISFSCNNCNLYGDLPTELDFTQHSIYDGMFLNDNQLSGDITILFPPANTGSTLYLSVSQNNFEGEFPAHLVNGFSRVIIQNNNYSSITDFGDVFLNSFNMKGNKFNYEALIPVQEYITNYDSIPINYENQQETLTPDTLIFSETTVLTIEAGDNHPNTVYEWLKNNQVLEGETSSTLTLTLEDTFDAGTYYCKMTNIDFPELDLRREAVRIIWDTTSRVEVEENSDIKIFPNPTSVYIQIYHKDSVIKNYQLYNSQGILLESKNYLGTIDINDLPSGLYYLQLDQKYITTIIKE